MSDYVRKNGKWKCKFCEHEVHKMMTEEELPKDCLKCPRPTVVFKTSRKKIK
jgi:hypothetical protein